MERKDMSVIKPLLLLLSLFSILTQGNKNDDPFQQGFCEAFNCQLGQEPIPKWPLKLSSRGCLGIDGLLSVKTELNNDPLEVCCRARDACYQTCGTLKKYCDETHIKCTQDVCAAMLDPRQKEECEKAARVHDLMVKMDKCQSHQKQQYRSCQCVPQQEAAQKRHDFLHKFYKKYNPSSLHKVEGIASKVQNSKQMAGVIGKLIQKFPQLIAQKPPPEDGREAEMERMQRQAMYQKEEDEELELERKAEERENKMKERRARVEL